MTQKLDLGRNGVLTIPEMSASDADKLHTVIGNDCLVEIINLTITDPITSVFGRWLNSLTSREYMQVREMCIGKARFRDSDGEVTFTRRSDEMKIISAVIYANLANLCNYMTIREVE